MCRKSPQLPLTPDRCGSCRLRCRLRLLGSERKAPSPSPLPPPLPPPSRSGCGASDAASAPSDTDTQTTPRTSAVHPWAPSTVPDPQRGVSPAGGDMMTQVEVPGWPPIARHLFLPSSWQLPLTRARGRVSRPFSHGSPSSLYPEM